MSDILNQNITQVQNLFNKRQPSPEAIYFVAPTLNSINQIIQDSRKQLYTIVHLYFITGLSDSLFDKLKQSRLNIKTLKELSIDFICPDPNYFSLETPDSFMNLYNPEAASLLQYELQKTAKKICSVLVQMEEYPYIRYSTKPQAFQTTPQKTITSELALLIQKELDAIARQDPSYPPQSKYPRAILLLVDRKVDCYSPLVHDIHYQSMLADLGSLHNRKITDGEKEYILDEQDLFWPQVRNWHISKVMDFVTEQFEKFKQENKAAQWELQGGRDKNLQQLKDVVTSFGDYQQTKDVVARHVSLCSIISNTFAERGLEPIVDLEQTLVTEGHCKLKEIEKLVSDPRIQMHDKVILILLYVICKEGISDKERQQLIDSAQFTIEETKALTNLGQLGVRLSPTMDKKQDDRNPYSISQCQRRNAAVPFEFENAKQLPALYFMIQDLIKDTMDTNWFPWVKPPPPNQPTPTADLATKKKPSWATRKIAQQTQSQEPQDLRDNGPRVLVFMLGGATCSEVRVCDMIQKAEKRQVLLGSTHLWTPDSFVEALKDFNIRGGSTFYGYKRPIPKPIKSKPEREGERGDPPRDHSRDEGYRRRDRDPQQRGAVPVDANRRRERPDYRARADSSPSSRSSSRDHRSESRDSPPYSRNEPPRAYARRGTNEPEERSPNASRRPLPPPRRNISQEPRDVEKDMSRVSLTDKEEKKETKKKRWFGF